MDLNELKKLINEEVKRTRQRNSLKEQEEITTQPNRSRPTMTQSDWENIKTPNLEKTKTDTHGDQSKRIPISPQQALREIINSSREFFHPRNEINRKKFYEAAKLDQNLKKFVEILTIAINNSAPGKEREAIQELSKFKDQNLFVPYQKESPAAPFINILNTIMTSIRKIGETDASEMTPDELERKRGMRDIIQTARQTGGQIGPPTVGGRLKK